jgi:serine protease Do
MICLDPLSSASPGRSPRTSFGSPATVVMPAGRLKKLFDNPAEKKKRPWLGLAHLQPLTPELARALGVADKPGGIIAGQILPGGPAEAAGMKAKDIIVRIAGTVVAAKDENEVRACTEFMKGLPIGEPVETAILREGKEETIRIVPVEWPKEEGEAIRYEDKALGMIVRELLYWDKLSRQLPVDTRGLFVQYVRPGSWPQIGGLSAGDILQKVDDAALAGGAEAIEQFRKIAEDLRREKKKKFVFFVSRGIRGENSTYINVEADWEKASEGK